MKKFDTDKVYESKIRIYQPYILERLNKHIDNTKTKHKSQNELFLSLILDGLELQEVLQEKYFKNMRVKLKNLKPYHIEGFYKSQYDKGLSSNSVLKFHILIRECLQYALKNDFVLSNVADKVTRPKAVGYKANFYSVEEIEKLFDVIFVLIQPLGLQNKD